jgi:hypothetical protein
MPLIITVDAPRGSHHLWLDLCRLHDHIRIRQWQQRQSFGLLPIPRRVHLHVAPLQAHRVAENSLLKPGDGAIHESQEDQSQRDGDQCDQRAPFVAPDVPPRHSDEFSHFIHLSA